MADRLTVNVDTCAKLLGISRGTAYTLVKQGSIPAIRLGPKRWVVPLAALEKMLSEAGNPSGQAGG
jgi:excisionase family DNA binding protein